MNRKDLKTFVDEIEIDGKTVVHEWRDRAYFVYILVKENTPIYIGCSESLDTRIPTHRKTKDFDSVIVAGAYSTRSTALFHEKCIIEYATKFGNVVNIKGNYRNNQILKLTNN